jgi:hypothetical protein
MGAIPPKEGNFPGGSELPRVLLAMSRPSQFREFWRFIVRFEELTSQESLQIQRGEFDSLEASQREKASLVVLIQNLGRLLGLDRGNRDLRLRLESLEQMERRNLEQIGAALTAARGEQQDTERSQINLRSLRGSYLRDPNPGEFFAEG